MVRVVYGAYQNAVPPLWDMVRFALGLVKLTTHKSGNRPPEAHIYCGIMGWGVKKLTIKMLTVH